MLVAMREPRVLWDIGLWSEFGRDADIAPVESVAADRAAAVTRCLLERRLDTRHIHLPPFVAMQVHRRKPTRIESSEHAKHGVRELICSHEPTQRDRGARYPGLPSCSHRKSQADGAGAASACRPRAYRDVSVPDARPAAVATRRSTCFCTQFRARRRRRDHPREAALRDDHVTRIALPRDTARGIRPTLAFGCQFTRLRTVARSFPSSNWRRCAPRPPTSRAIAPHPHAAPAARRGQPGRVVDLGQSAVDAVDDGLLGPAGARRDDRRAAGHRLHRHQVEAFAAARGQPHVATRVGLAQLVCGVCSAREMPWARSRCRPGAWSRPSRRSPRRAAHGARARSRPGRRRSPCCRCRCTACPAAGARLLARRGEEQRAIDRVRDDRAATRRLPSRSIASASPWRRRSFACPSR